MPAGVATAMVEHPEAASHDDIGDVDHTPAAPGCVEDVEQVAGAHLKYGEMEFQEMGEADHDGKRTCKSSGHRAKFCVVNKNEQDANSVLRFMFSWDQGWKMTPPNSFLECTSNLAESKRSTQWFQDYLEQAEAAADAVMNLEEFKKLGLEPTKDCPACAAMQPDAPKTEGEAPKHTKECETNFKKKKKEEKKKAQSKGQNNPLLEKVFNTLHTDDIQEAEDLYQVCLVETMKGLAATMHERKAWVDFGNGSVDGLKELMGIAFSQYWNDGIGAAASNKTPVVFAVRMVGEDKLFEAELTSIEDATLPFEDKEKPQQAPAPTPAKVEAKAKVDEAKVDEADEDVEGKTPRPVEAKAKVDEAKVDEAKVDPTAKPKLTKRVLYQFDAKHEDDETFDLTWPQSYISDVVTHVVFVHSFQVRDDLRTKLRGMGQRIALVANGDFGARGQGSKGQSLYRRILSDSKFGSQYIVFDNTGGAAQRVCDALKKQRKTPNTGYPDEVPANQFKVIDPLKPLDNCRKTLANVLFAIQETEETESGSVQAERKRLQYAWEQHAVFHLNSQHYHALARYLQFSVVLLAFLTTASAVISQQCGAKWEELTEEQFGNPDFAGWNSTVPGFLDKLCGFAPWGGGIISAKAVLADAYGKIFQTATILLPLFGSVVLSVINKTNPLLKWAHLKSGSVSMMCEIYLYRTRVTRYSRNAVSKDIEDKVEELCASTGAGGGGVGKRSIFATECQRIIADTLGSDMMYDYLDDPGTESKEGSVTLFDSEEMSNQGPSCFRRVFCCQGKAKQKPSKGGKGDSPSCFASLCGSGKAGKKNGLLSGGGGFGGEEEEEDDGAATDLWEVAGHDFKFNPSVMEGEVVRDDGCSLLNGEEYMHVRMYPLLQEYHHRAKVVGRAVKILQMTIMLTTGLTTLVAAMPHYDLRPCVPIMVAFVALLSTSLEFENYQSRLTNLQKSLETLKSLQVWWQSLSASERRLRANKERLVSTTEEQADAEISPWKKSSKSASGADQEEEGDKKK